MKIKVDILGSCVTRDAFQNLECSEIQVNNYISRMSVISLMSKKMENILDVDSSNMVTNYEKRMVKYSMNKEVLNILLNSKSDVVIIDLIDERLNLIDIDGGYISLSREMETSNLLYNIDYKIVDRLSEECQELWNKSIDLMSEFLTELSKNKLIILNKSYMSSTFITSSINKWCSLKNGYYSLKLSGVKAILPIKKELTFKRSIIKSNKIQNKLLDSYYDDLIKRNAYIKVIDNTNYKAYQGHRWGLSPFHYEDKYYTDLKENIKKIINSSKKDKLLNI